MSKGHCLDKMFGHVQLIPIATATSDGDPRSDLTNFLRRMLVLLQPVLFAPASDWHWAQMLNLMRRSVPLCEYLMNELLVLFYVSGQPIIIGQVRLSW